MRRQTVVILILFALGLLVFNIFTTRVLLTDSLQYLGSAKEFAGISTAKVRNMPGWIYPWFLGQFLKISPSLFMARMINASFLFFNALLIYYLTKSKKALLLWAFSPIVWLMTSWINPHLAVSFLLLSAYALFKEYEERDKLFYFVISGFCLGLASAIWWAGTYLAGFFVLAFFYDKKLLKTLLYLIPFGVGFSLRILFDWYYFGFPLFSIIRGFGSNVMFFLGKEVSLAPKVGTPYWLMFISLFVIISPLLYMLKDLNFKRYKSELIFVGLVFLLFFLNLQQRYFIIVAPFVIILLDKVVRRKDLWIHVSLSVIIAVVLVFPFFTSSIGHQVPLNVELYPDELIAEDLDMLAKDFPNERFIVGGADVSESQAFALSSLYWGSDIKEFIRYSEYELSLKDESVFREYGFSSDSRINNLRRLDFSLRYLRTDDKNYDDVKYLIIMGPKGKPAEGFEFVKEYEYLRVFER